MPRLTSLNLDINAHFLFYLLLSLAPDKIMFWLPFVFLEQRTVLCHGRWSDLTKKHISRIPIRFCYSYLHHHNIIAWTCYYDAGYYLFWVPDSLVGTIQNTSVLTVRHSVVICVTAQADMSQSPSGFRHEGGGEGSKFHPFCSILWLLSPLANCK